MNKPTEPVMDAEEIESDASAAPEKKGNLKLFVLLFLLLTLAAWAFWTYSPLVNQWRQQWLDINPEINLSPPHQPETAPQPAPQRPIEKPQDIPPETPLFAPNPALDEAVTPLDDVQLESLMALSTVLQQLQEQMTVLQRNMNQMQNQQLELAQQQVRAQIFTDLQQASSSQNNLEQRAAAWKSISLLPLIDKQRRDIAKQAFDNLQGLSRDALTLSDEVADLISALAAQLQPKDLADVAKTMDNLADTYANADTFTTWLDWLKAQFKISKVNQHAINISTDPYADIKALMTELYQLKASIRAGKWQDIETIDSLRYQLEQHGIQTSISADMIENMQQIQRSWQQEAKSWMEQL